MTRELADLAPDGRCLICTGKGTISNQQCQSCAGTGRLAQRDGYTCTLCEGTGVYLRYRVSPDGRTQSAYREERCQTCAGTGTMLTNDSRAYPPQASGPS